MARRSSDRQHRARPVIPQWTVDLTYDDLVHAFGATTVERGETYQRSSAVSLLRAAGNELKATVIGTDLYQSWAWLDDGADLASVTGMCSCPVGADCKHVVAALLEARHQLAAGTPLRDARSTPPRQAWRTLLDPVIAASTEPPATTVPLGLLIEIAPDRKGPDSAAGRLRIRPVQPGASRPWVKGPISWSGLRYHRPSRTHEPRQIEALEGILNAHQAPAWYSPTDWLSLDQFSPALWRALRYAQDAGLPLITGAAKPHPVRLLPEPVAVHMDARRDADGGLLLRTTVPLPDGAGVVRTLGDPPHGVFASSENGLLLAELSHPLAGPVGALLEQPGEIQIPAADAGTFLAHYYPALVRQATVESTDGSVRFPTYGPARLGLQVHSGDGHQLRLRWCFRYAVDDQTYELPLIAGAGQSVAGDGPGIAGSGTGRDAGSGTGPGRDAVPRDQGVVPRDRDAEERLLASLDVLGRVPGLLTAIPGKMRPGVVVEPRLRGWETAVFVREVLPVLQARDDIDVSVIGELLDYAEAVG